MRISQESAKADKITLLKETLIRELSIANLLYGFVSRKICDCYMLVFVIQWEILRAHLIILTLIEFIL